MYILQVKQEKVSWVDMLIKHSPYDLTDKYIELLNSFPANNVRIVKQVAVEVNTTVEVVK
ncbi:hypothetical protein P4639_14395 [Priestia megaterium]|uniref:hypothetical protein n=1 Tax=Priestia megaterium TaxID=1404 RepID=UPI002E1C2900|nr:hypothetical protein [Priestia megaterium]